MSPAIEVKVARPEDLPAADRLLEGVYSRYAGPIDRTRMPRRSDLSRELHLLAIADGRSVGTATFNASGGVLDWAIVEGADTDSIAAALLAAGEAWVKDQGGTEILLYAPPIGAPSEERMRQIGFRPVHPPYMVMQLVDFPGFLGAVARARADRFRALAPFRLALHLERGLYPPLFEPDLQVEVTPEGAAVTTGAGPADATLTTTATAFSEFLFGARDIDGLFQTGAVILPAERKEAAVRVIALLAVQQPWFVPLGERR